MLHAFQKKSKRGIKTAPAEIAKVRVRLKEAEKHHAAWIEEQRESQGNQGEADAR